MIFCCNDLMLYPLIYYRLFNLFNIELESGDPNKQHSDSVSHRDGYVSFSTLDENLGKESKIEERLKVSGSKNFTFLEATVDIIHVHAIEANDAMFREANTSHVK